MKLALRTLLSFCLLSPINASSAQESRDWTLNGSELLYKLSANEASVNLSADPRALNAEALGYISAIMDTQDWCLKGKTLPHEIVERVFSQLITLDTHALHANAGMLVKDVLQSYCKQ